jgi:signal transduction histidine kinase
VRLTRRGQNAVLAIQDDGVGFVPGAAEPRGLGLVTMRERAEIMGATLTIQSRPRRGTEVRVVLPLASPRPTTDAAV